MSHHTRRIQKLLIANRGEIAIRIMRAATELNIRTVAVYTYEDRYSLHRYKADEAYQLGKNDEPLKPYLDIEAIIQLAKQKQVDAIHPGYGFLSENVAFARRCREENIAFIGPSPEAMEALGDKVAAKNVAIKVNVPIIQDSKELLKNSKIALAEAKKIGFPVMLKAVAGGGGRGMRVVHEESTLEKSFNEAQNEAQNAFGNDTVFVEKFVDNPKHIEIQLLGDNHGNLVHLYERDCSIQRRFQKVVEVAPSFGLKPETKQKLYEYALAIGREVKYSNAGTVEFLVDEAENIYFIEVNPRIQVEHTITEEITGIDLVRTQILIAMNHKLSDKEIFITEQSDIKLQGAAIQCRITTEDPANGFKPDFGTIIAYRNAGGFGIRLDEGSTYPGMKISPYFDSMLVKISSKGRTLKGATQRLQRALVEFRIRGVKTNIPFLLNVISHPKFQEGKATVKFIDNHPELFQLRKAKDRSTKLLMYLAEVIVNGNPDVLKKDDTKVFRVPKVPVFDEYSDYPVGNKDRLNRMGVEKFVRWLKDNPTLLYTDTTFRDAHQSLLATRFRTQDMLNIARSFAKANPDLFSMEVWGGATFDVAMRFLHESPWKRLQLFREAMPNMLLQMLIRGNNAVGYSNYPKNLIENFIEQSSKNGIDIFRIFDSLNWIQSMKTSIQAIRERTNSLAEGCICYTSDIFTSQKYNLAYYLDKARELEDMGIHILGIKDMAGLLRPFQAYELISALKKVVNLPIHLHTHDTSSLQSATYLKAMEAGVNVIDCSIASLSGLTSQPSLNSMIAAMQGHERATPMNLKSLNEYSTYWEDVREYYYPFESDLKAGTAEVYDHEIPGGQYSNLRPQATALGVGNRFDVLKRNYHLANQLLGDIVKVTPSSKVVGDLSIFMTINNLDEKTIFEKGESLSFPESVKGLLRGELGEVEGGFPEKFSNLVLKDSSKNSTNLPSLEEVNITTDFEEFKKQFPEHKEGILDYLSYKMYPKVYEDYYQTQEKYGDVSVLPTLSFFYGLKPNEEIIIPLDEGKSILVKFLFFSEPDERGYRLVTFELNAQTRRIYVLDKKAKVEKISHKKASGDSHIGSPLQGRLSKIMVKIGEKVQPNTPLFVIEAMKMESIVSSPKAGVIQNIVLLEGTVVEQDDLIMEMS